MHPQNVFWEAMILFLVGLALWIRDRGSVVSSTNYDTLLGCLLVVFGFVRLLEFFSGTVSGGEVMARGIAWIMWMIPIVILSWLLIQHHRLEIAIVLVITIFALIAVTIYLISGGGDYNIETPNQRVGSSSGIYTWIQEDGLTSTRGEIIHRQFLPFGYYILLTIALIYLTAVSITDPIYWLFAGMITFAFVFSAFLIPEVMKNPLGCLGSLASLVMLGLGVFAILIVPG